MDTIKRAIELLEERAQAFDEAKQELLDAYEAEHAGSKKKARRGKKIVLSSVGTPEDYVSNGIDFDRPEDLWDLFEAKRLAPADSVILPGAMAASALRTARRSPTTSRCRAGRRTS